MRYDIVGCGSITMDMFLSADRLIGQGEKTILIPAADGEYISKRVGGVTLNHIAWATILGLKTSFFGRHGDDDVSRFIVDKMDLFGIGREHIRRDGDTTAMAIILVDPSGERSIYMATGATGSITDRYIEKYFKDIIASGDIVSTEISQLKLRAVLSICKLASRFKKDIFLDVDIPRSYAAGTANLGTEKEFEEILQLSNVMKPTSAAAYELVSNDSLTLEETIVSLFKKYNRYNNKKWIAITDGINGSVISDGKNVHREKSFRINSVKDTTGAGDAYFGGLIAAYHYKLSLMEASRLANACGAVCCQSVGAFPDIRSSRRSVLKIFNKKSFRPVAHNIPESKKCSIGEDVKSYFKEALEELDGLRDDIKLEMIDKSMKMILESERNGGRVHVTGIGKPEHIARYAASLLSSTGTPAYFLHGTEVTHGSAGQVVRGDVVIAISNSGKSLIDAVDVVKRMGAKIIAVTGNLNSPLARISDTVIYAGVKREGGPLGYAPRSSILAEIYILAGLSVALQSAKRFSKKEYNKRHPAGMLGKISK